MVDYGLFNCHEGGRPPGLTRPGAHRLQDSLRRGLGDFLPLTRHVPITGTDPPSLELRAVHPFFLIRLWYP